jgi:imidazolonepropionase-like amidohydrolase
MKQAIDARQLVGPRIVPSGLMIAQQGCLGDEGGLMEVVSDAKSLREVVARQCDAGVRAIKLFISGDGAVPAFPSEDVYMNDGMLEAAVREADRHGAFISAHARAADSVTMAARTGVRLIHHACFLHDEALRALDARNDVWVCPGLHYLYAMVNGHAEPWGISASHVAAFGYPRELESQVQGLKRLVSAGIRIVAGGDFGHQWTRHGTYAAELQRYVELVGMTPMAAVLTATRNMGPLVELPLGQVAEGYLADLLILDADPSRDISVLQDASKRRAVMKHGRFVYVNPDLVL